MFIMNGYKQEAPMELFMIYHQEQRFPYLTCKYDLYVRHAAGHAQLNSRNENTNQSGVRCSLYINLFLAYQLTTLRSPRSLRAFYLNCINWQKIVLLTY